MTTGRQQTALSVICMLEFLVIKEMIMLSRQSEPRCGIGLPSALSTSACQSTRELAWMRSGAATT